MLCVPEPSGLSRRRAPRQTLRESGFAPGGSEHNANCGARPVPARLDLSQMQAPGTCRCGAFGHNGSAAAGTLGQELARRTICSGYCHSVLETVGATVLLKYQSLSTLPQPGGKLRLEQNRMLEQGLRCCNRELDPYEYSRYL